MKRKRSVFPNFRSIGWVGLALAVSLVATSTQQGHAQSQQSSQSVTPDPAASAPAIRVATRLVQVGVIVQDEHGDPISGLRKDDFELLDQGKQQRISEFSVLAAPTSAPTAVQTAASPVPTNVFSNRADSQSDVAPQVSVILLDLSNTGTLEMSWARGKAIKFLETIRPQDSVAIYSLGAELVMLHGFSNDANSLIASLSKASTRESRAKTASKFEGSSTVRSVSPNDAVIRQQLNGMEAERLTAIATARVKSTADALAEIAHNLAGLRGRKSLIWLSSAFPPFVMRSYGRGSTIRTYFADDITRATRALTDANVAVYPIDPRGLPDAIYMGRAAPSGLKPLPEADYAVMDSIAELTGGKASYHTNDIEGSIRRAVDDSRVTYMLGYYPDHNQWDGEFREIKVKVNAKGADVRYRRGYFATKDATPSGGKNRVQLMLAAASAPLESTLLGVRLELLPGAPKFLKARLTVDLRDIALNSEGGRRTGSIDFFYAEIGSNRNVLSSKTQTLSLNLSDATYQKTMKDGVKILCNFPINAGAEMIRVVALDDNSGSTGTVTILASALGAANK